MDHGTPSATGIRASDQLQRGNVQRWPRPSDQRAARGEHDAQESRTQAGRSCPVRLRIRPDDNASYNGKRRQANDLRNPRGGKGAASPILSKGAKGNGKGKGTGDASPVQAAPKKNWSPKAVGVSRSGAEPMEPIPEQGEVSLSQNGDVTRAAAAAKDNIERCAQCKAETGTA